MRIREEIADNFSSVVQADTDVFSDLVKLSGLRPDQDFRHARLADVDFTDSDLQNFNFEYADLRRVVWEGRVSDPSHLGYSLRGQGNDEVSGSDFEAITAKIVSKSLWAERFYAFKVLVDNWGENGDTALVLMKLLKEDQGTYLRLCCFTYFSSSFINDRQSMKLCVDMADSGNSQVNIFRLKRIRRVMVQNLKMLENMRSEHRYPNHLSDEQISSFRSILKNGLLSGASETDLFG